MRLLTSLSALTLFLVSTTLALPRPHSLANPPSLLPRQEVNDRGIPNDRPLLRNTGFVMQQSDFDKDGNLKPKARERQEATAEVPITEFDPARCELGADNEAEDSGGIKMSAALWEQLRELCAMLDDRTQA